MTTFFIIETISFRFSQVGEYALLAFRTVTSGYTRVQNLALSISTGAELPYAVDE